VSYNNIPFELQALRQWLCWRYETLPNGSQTKIPLNPLNLHKASVTNPLDWNTFEKACANTKLSNVDGIGFVFTASDPYVGIDLDNANGDPAIIRRHNELYVEMQTYSELSPSGKGLHMICKGKLPGITGRRRNKIECYDKERFFTFTGNRTNAYNIEYRQEALDRLYVELGTREFKLADFDRNESQSLSDYEIVDRARTASNGEKFMRLMQGNWQTDYGHCGSSDGISNNQADFALINIIAFYTFNRAQIVRIFRSSGLARRDKAKRDKYLNDMVSRAFDRLPPKPDFDALYNQRLEILARLGIVPE
jgi:primase-polymerase (primpol)-like protein